MLYPNLRPAFWHNAQWAANPALLHQPGKDITSPHDKHSQIPFLCNKRIWTCSLMSSSRKCSHLFDSMSQMSHCFESSDAWSVTAWNWADTIVQHWGHLQGKLWDWDQFTPNSSEQGPCVSHLDVSINLFSQFALSGEEVCSLSLFFQNSHSILACSMPLPLLSTLLLLKTLVLRVPSLLPKETSESSVFFLLVHDSSLIPYSPQPFQVTPPAFFHKGLFYVLWYRQWSGGRG